MSESSFFKDLGGEIVDRATSIASIGLAGFVLLFSALGLAGFQPVEAGNSVLASVNLHPAVLGEQDYQMSVVYKGTVLDLGVTPYSYDPGSGKWNYKISWNRKNGPVGNIYINGNLLYQGAYGIGEVYTGFNLNANSTYSLSYSYGSDTGRATVTKYVFKGTFKTFDGTGNTPVTSSQGNSVSNPATANTNRTGTVPSYGYTQPSYGYFNVYSPYSGQVVDTGFTFSGAIGNSYAMSGPVNVSLSQSNIVKSVDVGFSKISETRTAAEVNTWIDTSSLANGEYYVVSNVKLKDGYYTSGSYSLKIIVKHPSPTPSYGYGSPTYGYVSVSAPSGGSVVNNQLSYRGTAANSSGLSGSGTIYIDGKSFGAISITSTCVNSSNLLACLSFDGQVTISSLAPGYHSVEFRFYTLPLGSTGSISGTSSFNFVPPTVFPDFLMDKTDYSVGQAAYYGVTNVTPNAGIYWSSTKNGVSTGETCANYGQTTNSAGTWTSYGNAWTSNDIGTWTKTVYIGTCSGTGITKTFTVK